MTDSSRPTPSADGPRVVGVGNALVDRTYLLSNLPEPDGGASVEDYEVRPGGVEANVIAALARLGHEAGIVARLGDDAVAETVLADLDDRGVDRSRVRIVDGETSSYCLVLRNRAGERMIIGGGEGTANLRLDDADLTYLADADAVFTSGYAPARVHGTLATARESGQIRSLVFDLAGRLADLQTRGLDAGTIDATAAACDLFLGNRAAVDSYVGGTNLDESVERLRSRGISRGAVTDGESGATLFDGDRRASVPAFDVDVTDTTGAGDAFAAGLTDAWLLRDEPMEQAGRFAAAVAALACTGEGARGNLPACREVTEFLTTRAAE